ncbi:biotin--[acetyl-CoA-carboxylase] ligase [Flavobacterium rhizosphaerae]|uniref:Biotin--[acetyl-CoA-carboxylase] ligase n=1 Tax=Flavobacterium rhizosphaerae TaxID=3163298 RepID=A0ABW8YUR7_9FLAO
MNVIKLSAINSTNDYLKQLCTTQYVENFTLVVAENQIQGRGQMGAEWQVEPGKNLTFSVLVKDLLLGIDEIFNLNAATAVSIAQALENENISGISIKWPNDILAGNKKTGGILIENSIKNNGEIFSIIGIGLNVNQMGFNGLPKATSLFNHAGRQFDKYDLMVKIGEQLKQNVSRLRNDDSSSIWKYYEQKLYRKGIPSAFEKNNERFMGIIKGVGKTGLLQVQLEDDTIAEYKIKEVQLLY